MIDRREFLAASCVAVGLAGRMTRTPAQAKSARVRVVGLKTDYIDRPMGVETLNPSLSWRLQSNERNVRQSAYRILVAKSESALKTERGDLWDSGKVPSRRSVAVPYRGRELTSRQRCFWCVQVWDKNDNASGWSDVSWWEMGLLDPVDWQAQWLAVEDAVAKADRLAGLRWIWGHYTGQHL